MAQTKALPASPRTKPTRKISPEDYILAVLSPQQKLDAAFKMARQAFKGTSLTLADIEAAVEKVRRKVYAKGRKKGSSRR